MRKLAEKGGFLWFVLAMTPMAYIVNIIGKSIELDTGVLIYIQSPLLLLQLFALFMIIKYDEEIL